MTWICRGGTSHAWRRVRLMAVSALLPAVVTAAAAAPADASRKPTHAEARAIKRAFLKDRDVETRVREIRVSTADPDYSAVTYEVSIPELAAPRLLAAGRETKPFKAPTPELLKESKGGKWKPVAKPPKKVKKDLKKKAKSDIGISGETSASLTSSAACTEDRDFYSAGIYNPAADVYLSIEMPSYTGPHAYPALGVHSLAALSVGNGGGPPQFETGQGNDAFADSGVIYVDAGGWGIIEATMARQPDESGTYPQSVTVTGFWVCG